MAENYNTTQISKHVPEKVKNTSSTCRFQTIFRVSDRNNAAPMQTTHPARGAHVSQSRPASHRQPGSGLVQKRGKLTKMLTNKHGARTEDKTPHFLAAEGRPNPLMERGGTDLGTDQNRTNNSGVNDEFSEYINRVKNNKIGDGSNHDIGRTATKISRRDSFNHKLTSFIKRARIKMRTTSSSIGDANSFSSRGANDR